MSKIKGHDNLATERRLIGIFRLYSIKGWRRRSRIFGKPDFVFPAARLAVFVDGCFWHGCPAHGSVPSTNHLFWTRKIDRNIMRDKLVRRRLTETGWRVTRVWQHELRKPELVARKVRRALAQEINSKNRD